MNDSGTPASASCVVPPRRSEFELIPSLLIPSLLMPLEATLLEADVEGANPPALRGCPKRVHEVGEVQRELSA